ncbi:MAG: sulfite exporter TauE/SafE family protein [Alphaproteobacteria bacterium]|nr:sulfite exporter TauE/SafE family protein [Alphaproteobacteria bacterium]
MEPTLISGALLAGLVGTPHCLGMCGGFAVASADRPLHGVAWHLGRLFTYGALGAAAGALGGSVPGPGWLGTALAAGLLVWFSGRLAGLLPAPRLPVNGLVAAAGRSLRAAGVQARFVFGLLNGLLPCGLVYAALALPVASGDPLTGALAMLAFGLGTLPGLSAAMLGLRRLTAQRPWSRRLLAVGVLGFGLAALAVRAPAPDAAADAPPACHTE